MKVNFERRRRKLYVYGWVIDKRTSEMYDEYHKNTKGMDACASSYIALRTKT